ncbi:MAG: HAD family hydrolase [Candidatus Saccharimonadales bacterium]
MVKNVHPPEIKAVLFEANGVLLDMEPLAKQDQHVARTEFGLELSTEEIRALWRHSLAEDFYPALFKGGRGADQLTWEQMRAIFQGYDDSDPAFMGQPLPDAAATLDTLRQSGVKTGLVTVTPADLIEKRMRHAGLWQDKLDLIHAGAETEARAGRPLLGRSIGQLATWDIAPQEVLYVGPQPSVATEAAAINAQYAAVSTGAYSHMELLAAGIPPERLIHGLGQLPGLLGIQNA